jgi:flagellar biosynthesis/type III secretory pathway protein FliH
MQFMGLNTNPYEEYNITSGLNKCLNGVMPDEDMGNEDFDEDLTKIYKKGYHEGYVTSYGLGFNEGFAQGEEDSTGLIDAELDAGVLTVSSEDVGYNAGFLEGIKKGYAQSYMEGFRDCFIKNCSFDEPLPDYDDLYEQVYSIGCDDGKFAGHTQGYRDGYRSGFENRLSEWIDYGAKLTKV